MVRIRLVPKELRPSYGSDLRRIALATAHRRELPAGNRIGKDLSNLSYSFGDSGWQSVETSLKFDQPSHCHSECWCFCEMVMKARFA